MAADDLDKRLRKPQAEGAGDDSPIVEWATQTEAPFTGATAENVASMFELEADRAALTGELAEWAAAMMRSGFASGIETE